MSHFHIALIAAIVGALAWLILRRMPRLTRCQWCKKLTPWYPRPHVPPGASHPHLRCKRCGAFID